MRCVAGGRAEWAVVDRLSSEVLGFAPDARVLIVNCDDFGMHDAVNAAVVESIENGIASSCSLMVPCPGPVLPPCIGHRWPLGGPRIAGDLPHGSVPVREPGDDAAGSV